MDPLLARKLSSPGKAQLYGKDLSTMPVLRFFVRVSRTDNDAIQEIRDCGVSIRTEAGDVLTCEARGEVLERIAALEQVISIEPTQKLYPES